MNIVSILRVVPCYLCQVMGGQRIGQPPKVGKIDGSSARIKEHTPSQAYLDGKMPTYEVSDLVEHFQYRIGIHETYWGLVEDDPGTWSAFGSAEYHQWAIEGYENAIYYMRGELWL